MPLPDILNTGFKSDEQRLRDVDIPVEEIALSDLDNNLDIAYLEQEGTDDWNLTPRMLLDSLAKEVTHAKQVEKVNFNYPINIYFHQGQWIILDGVHRYVKAHLKGARTIKVRRISEKNAQQNRMN